MLMLHNHDSWAWALAVALISADIILPIPQTAVIAALGILYGPLYGGLLGSLGLILGGFLGYGLMLTTARRCARRFAGHRRLLEMQSLFDRSGTWAIILTRSLPYSLAEIVILLAGLARMPIGKFSTALIIGSVPTAFAFAAMGAGWANQPILALAVSYVVPMLLLPVVAYLVPPRAR